MSKSHLPEEVWVKTEPDWDEGTSGEELRPSELVSTEHVHIKVETEIIKEEPESIKEEPNWEDAGTLAPAGFAAHLGKDKPEESEGWREEASTSGNHKVVVRAAPHANHEVKGQVMPQSSGASQACASETTGSPGRSRRAQEDGHLTQDNTDSTTKPYSCTICNRKYARSSHLRRHEQTHTGKKPYSCKICKHKFTLLDNLRRHQRTHTGARPYSCDICKKEFTDASYLKTHKRIHTGEKPYFCKICNKKFMQSSNLKKHELIHTGVKLYSCSICGQKCTEKGTLKKHERIHTGEKPFCCKICPKKFISCSNLKRHERTHKLEHFIPEEYLNRSLCS